MGEGEGGKMLGSLRLGLTTVSKKIGTKNAELLRKLEICNGGHRPRPEVTSPLWAEHQENINLSTNPLTLQNVLEPLESGKDVTKIVIGPQQMRKARPGLKTQSGRLYQGPGQARPRAGVGAGVGARDSFSS